ncbi:MAG: hypothetical protein A3J93_03650 [Candidatus Magasanikbacteria bacterium RIFOXYC2_FULL_42_28]|uniref:Uncharacterized protein n=1 Tax=Candidatus Magasanikbacteria bacterium RIFOXYC2_FULL_42_28 TaxID=1798704 RepID=A0A1F6NUH8_9BACT|nr:MAG: hypothetical protein A3J93_03650 [Candidatus Magasanikbacteria bacterium RIFOXYC2_FULL_42_28]
MAENNEEPAVKNNLSKEQKIGFILMLFFAIFAIGLGVLQIRNTFHAPFALNSQIPNAVKDEVNTVEALRYRDTDRDGLNDFDEIYVYTTSAYIVDTDSDGLADKEEVDGGTNPLCAEGADCATLASAGAEEPLSGTSTFVGLPGANDLTDFGPIPVDLEVALKDPAQVRVLLAQAGVQKELIEKISDADLMKMVAEVLAADLSTNQDTGSSIDALNRLLSTTTTKQ